MLTLGKYKGKMVTTNDRSLKNRHICVTGSSGSGKSVECQKLICSGVEHGATIIAIDMYGTLTDDQIFWKYKPAFYKYLNEIDAHKNGIPCDLFTCITYPDRTIERPIDAVGGIADIIANAIRAGSIQRTEIRKAVQYVYDSGAYKEKGFNAMDEALHNIGSKTAEALREKLYLLTTHNVFIHGNKLFEEQKINVFRLSHFNRKAQQLIAEMLLSYIWRLANADQFKQHEIYVFIDECQNMPSGKDDALAQILSEGRKFGINLILATQMLLQGTTSAVQQRITQCGLMLYFKPTGNSVRMISKIINPMAVNEWSGLLKTLEIGEFIADGSFIVDGRVKNGALKISAVESRESYV